MSNVTVTTSGGTSGAVGFTVNAAPGSITATGGTPQGAVFYTEFAPLVATVKDAAGNPVAGVGVRFQAPEDGSGCHFEANWAPAGAQARRPGAPRRAPRAGGPQPRSIGAPSYSVSATTDGSGAATAWCVAEPVAGAYTVTASVEGVAAAAIFNLTNMYPAPTLNSVSPASGAPGAAVSVTLAGWEFAPGATVAVSNAGIAVSGVTVVSDTQITATFTIAANAAAGAADVTVTTSGGTSNAASFAVTGGGPSIGGLSVTSGAVGTPVRITGSGFGGTQGGSTVTFGSVSAGMASDWRETSITVAVPAEAGISGCTRSNWCAASCDRPTRALDTTGRSRGT